MVRFEPKLARMSSRQTHTANALAKQAHIEFSTRTYQINAATLSRVMMVMIRFGQSNKQDMFSRRRCQIGHKHAIRQHQHLPQQISWKIISRTGDLLDLSLARAHRTDSKLTRAVAGKSEGMRSNWRATARRFRDFH